MENMSPEKLAVIAAMVVMLNAGTDDETILKESTAEKIGDDECTPELLAELLALAKTEAAKQAQANTQASGKGGKQPKTDKPAAKEKEAPECIKPILDVYPDNKVFYYTTDGQVFLQADKQWANEHQKTLKDGEVKTYSR